MQRVEMQPDKPYTVAIYLESKWFQYQIHSQTYFLFTRCYSVWYGHYRRDTLSSLLWLDSQTFYLKLSFPWCLTLSYTVIAYLRGSLVPLVFGPFKSACWTRPVKLAICCSIAFIRSLQKHQKILLSTLRPIGYHSCHESKHSLRMKMGGL